MAAPDTGKPDEPGEDAEAEQGHYCRACEVVIPSGETDADDD